MRTTHTIIERIRITGRTDESTKAFDYCARHGYHVTRSGPRQINSMRYDTTRFVIIAEREKEAQP